MFDTPDAEPTWFAETHAVDADEAGPFDRPMPTATATRGSRNAVYFQSEWTKPTATKPIVVRRKPTAMTRRPPKRAASLGTRGAVATRPTVAGRVASPAWSGLKANVLGS